jgi:phage baseplate assembly protein W
MRQKHKIKRRSPKTVLRLPDLDHSKSSVLQTLGSAASQRTYGHVRSYLLQASYRALLYVIYRAKAGAN